jgi:hypothetical protein
MLAKQAFYHSSSIILKVNIVKIKQPETMPEL